MSTPPQGEAIELLPCPSDRTTDGTIQYMPECHCFGCGQGALGLLRNNVQGDLRDRGWVRINRRWHCHGCAKDRGK